jgi:long-chain acyl-CoA synthetase
VEVTVADDGEVLVRGPNVFKGYHGKPEATREAIDDEGFLHTGDIGVLDADGTLRITDRKKNLLITAGGKNVAPAAIEALLAGEPLLGPVVLVGDTRPYVAALLTLDLEEARAVAGARGAGADLLARHPSVVARVRAAVVKANADLARFEKVRRFLILDRELSIAGGELTPTLKVRRRVVIERYAREIDRLYATPAPADVVDVTTGA